VLVVHRTVALVVVILALAGTLWAVHDWLRRGAIHPRLLTLTVAMSAVIGLQALFGILLALTGNRPVDGATHFVVGPLTLFVLPGRHSPHGQPLRSACHAAASELRV
jgi:heme A synthase